MNRRVNPWSLLVPLSWLFAGGSALRNAMYDHGLRRIHRTDVRVISVGSLLAGGSGKTPLTIEIVRLLLDGIVPKERWRDGVAPVMVVSRGYGRCSRGLQIVSDGHELLLTPEAGGDEPLLIAKSLPGVPVIVCGDRVAAVREGEHLFGAHLAVLDDGFSHRRIARDLDIVLLNANVPRWWWRPLPAGRLREWPGMLRRAQLIITDDEQYARELEPWLRGLRCEAEIVRIQRRASQLTDLSGGIAAPLEELKGRKVAVVCGIARPELFHSEIEALGAQIVARVVEADHAPWTAAQRDRVMKSARAAEAELVLLTAKDAVKWPLEPGEPPVRILQQVLDWPESRQAVLDRLHRVWETAAG